MPPDRRGRNGQRSCPPADGGDRLGALPDDLLHLVLSFLPAEEAVRTCILARRWRHLWKSATGLRIVHEMRDLESVNAVREFVDHLLLLRGDSPLDTVELFLDFHDLEDDVRDNESRIKLWIRHILMRKVRVLSLKIDREIAAELNGLTLTSNHLSKLHLSAIQLGDNLFDISRCPALEVLEFDNVIFCNAHTISSQSLKCLSFCHDCMFEEHSRIHIDAPNLRSLRLEVDCNRTPMLTRMPFLMKAFVLLSYDSSCDECDACENSASSGDCEDDDCSGCYGVDGDTDNCVLLQGLSEARNLVLISDAEIFIFRRDLKWCPIFGNLKTLLLNEYWCLPADFSALTYMLEHSPVLEKLTLQLYLMGPKYKVKTLKGSPDPTDRTAAMPKHLKIVEVKYEVVDDKVLDVLKFLSKLGICFRFLD